MAQTLVKFKHIEDTSDNTSFIKAMWSDSPLIILELAEKTGNIILEDETYFYEFSEFIPAINREFANVLVIYVDNYVDSWGGHYLN